MHKIHLPMVTIEAPSPSIRGKPDFGRLPIIIRLLSMYSLCRLEDDLTVSTDSLSVTHSIMDLDDREARINHTGSVLEGVEVHGLTEKEVSVLSSSCSGLNEVMKNWTGIADNWINMNLNQVIERLLKEKYVFYVAYQYLYLVVVLHGFKHKWMTANDQLQMVLQSSEWSVESIQKMVQNQAGSNWAIPLLCPWLDNSDNLKPENLYLLSEKCIKHFNPVIQHLGLSMIKDFNLFPLKDISLIFTTGESYQNVALSGLNVLFHIYSLIRDFPLEQAKEKVQAVRKCFSEKNELFYPIISYWQHPSRKSIFFNNVKPELQTSAMVQFLLNKLPEFYSPHWQFMASRLSLPTFHLEICESFSHQTPSSLPELLSRLTHHLQQPLNVIEFPHFQCLVFKGTFLYHIAYFSNVDKVLMLKSKPSLPKSFAKVEKSCSNWIIKSRGNMDRIRQMLLGVSNRHGWRFLESETLSEEWLGRTNETFKEMPESIIQSWYLEPYKKQNHSRRPSIASLNKSLTDASTKDVLTWKDVYFGFKADAVNPIVNIIPLSTK